MAKVKAMSRNKTIKFYHQISGLSYKECRTNLKRNNWDIFQVYGVGLTTAIEGLSEAIGEIINIMVSAVRECFEKFGKALNESIDRVKMENAKDITEDPPVIISEGGYLGGVDMSDTKDITVYNIRRLDYEKYN